MACLIKGMNAWVLEKTKPLGQILQEQGALRADREQFVEAMIDKHLEAHNNDPQKSLAAVSAFGSVRQDLESIADAELEKSLAQISVTPRENGAPATISYAVGTSTSAGTRFRILRPHAKGGLGEVFVAQDKELNREVALKEIQERHAGSPESRARFLLEAEITGGLEHPGIVPVYGLGQYADGRPFYAMRFIRGDSLRDAIRHYHAKPEGEASSPGGHSLGKLLEFRKLLGRFIDVCNAVAYAHSRGVLHRDLKPGNIMLGTYGETLVVDWGLAKASGDAASGEPGASAPGLELPLRPASPSGSAETQAGTALGTPQFMSPEQAAGRPDLLGPPSDVYSLGATLYCLLTGRVPFEDDDLGVVLQKVQRGEFPRPAQINNTVPPALEAVCLKAMALKPGQRYTSPRALADDIEHWLADEPVAAWPEPWTVTTGRWMRRHKPLVSGVAAAILVGLIGLTGGLLWYQDEQNRRSTEAALRQAEAYRNRMLAEEGIRSALTQAEQSHKELHDILKKPGGVFGLLNDPARWKAHIQAVRGHLDLALAVLANAGERVDPDLAKEVATQEAIVRQDEADRLLAVCLEEIRMNRTAVVEGNFDFSTANREYERAFADSGPRVSIGSPSLCGQPAARPTAAWAPRLSPKTSFPRPLPLIRKGTSLVRGSRVAIVKE
jgi:serine/threonine-protein kinase